MTERTRTRRRTPDPDAAEIGPRAIGGTYRNDGTAQADGQPFEYRVTALTRSTHAGWSLRAHVTDGPDTGNTRRIDTPWDEQHDTVIHHNGTQR
jgi:hypothetical protein